MTTHARLHAVAAVVADTTGISVGDMCGADRSRSITRARHMAMWLARRTLPVSFPDIGRFFGGRNHATVMHAVGLIETQRHRDEDLNLTISRLLHAVGGSLVREARPAQPSSPRRNHPRIRRDHDRDA